MDGAQRGVRQRATTVHLLTGSRISRRPVAKVPDNSLEPAPISRRHGPMPNPPRVHAAGLPNEPAQAGMHGIETMTTGNPLEQYELTPEGKSRIGWLAAALGLVLAIGAGIWGFTAQRRADTAEQSLAAVAAERDAAVATAEQAQQLATQVEAEGKAGEARVGELEQQVQALDSPTSGRECRCDPPPLGAGRSRGDDRRSGGPSASARGRSTSASLARQSGGGRDRAGGSPVCTDSACSRQPKSLAITFEVNSSYLPANLDGRLRELAEGLEAVAATRWSWSAVSATTRSPASRPKRPFATTAGWPMPGEPRSRVPAEERQDRHADDQAGIRAQRFVTPGTGRGPAALGLAQAGGTGRGRRCSSMATKVKSAPVT